MKLLTTFFLAFGISFPVLAEQIVPLKLVPSMFGAGSMSARCAAENLEVECSIDTGANVSSLRGSFFQEKKVLGTSKYQSATGALQICQNIQIDKIGPAAAGALESLEVVRCAAEKGEKPKMLLGLDYMKNKIIDFEMKNSRLVLNSERSLEILYNMDFDSYGHPVMQVELKTQPALAMWDSGAGLTLVASDFVDAHPELFDVLSSTNTGLKDTHGNPIVNRLVLVKVMTIGNKKFVSEYAMAVDFAAIRELSGKNFDFMIGYNFIKQANWRLDFAKSQWGIY